SDQVVSDPSESATVVERVRFQPTNVLDPGGDQVPQPDGPIPGHSYYRIFKVVHQIPSIAEERGASPRRLLVDNDSYAPIVQLNPIAFQVRNRASLQSSPNLSKIRLACDIPRSNVLVHELSELVEFVRG